MKATANQNLGLGTAKAASPKLQTTEELEGALGASLKALRLSRNIPQRVLAERAGVGITALKNLEGGLGASVATLVRVVRALGREGWLESVAPVATINPLNMVRHADIRQRARIKIAKGTQKTGERVHSSHSYISKPDSESQ